MTNTKHPVYDVLATVDPTGKGVASNVLVHRMFSTINNHMEHEDTRWVVLVESDKPKVVKVADLWATSLTDTFPYTNPWFIEETFASADQAVAFVALNLVI